MKGPCLPWLSQQSRWHSAWHRIVIGDGRLSQWVITLASLFALVDFNHLRLNGSSVLNNCSVIQPWVTIDAHHKCMLKDMVPFLPYSNLFDLSNFNDIVPWVSLLNVKRDSSNIVSVVKFNYSSFCGIFHSASFFCWV